MLPDGAVDTAEAPLGQPLKKQKLSEPVIGGGSVDEQGGQRLKSLNALSSSSAGTTASLVNSPTKSAVPASPKVHYCKDERCTLEHETTSNNVDDGYRSAERLHARHL